MLMFWPASLTEASRATVMCQQMKAVLNATVEGAESIWASADLTKTVAI